MRVFTPPQKKRRVKKGRSNRAEKEKERMRGGLPKKKRRCFFSVEKTVNTDSVLGYRSESGKKRERESTL